MRSEVTKVNFQNQSLAMRQKCYVMLTFPNFLYTTEDWVQLLLTKTYFRMLYLLF